MRFDRQAQPALRALQSDEVDRIRQRLYAQYQDSAPTERMLRFIDDIDDEGRCK